MSEEGAQEGLNSEERSQEDHFHRVLHILKDLGPKVAQVFLLRPVPLKLSSYLPQQ